MYSALGKKTRLLEYSVLHVVAGLSTQQESETHVNKTIFLLCLLSVYIYKKRLLD